MATWALGQYYRSVTYILIKQVRILLHIGGQEVCRSSNKKCVRSGRVAQPATKTETFWLTFKMPLSVSWPAISHNSQRAQKTRLWNVASQHGLRTCLLDMTSQHDLRTMTAIHDHGRWVWKMTVEHDLRPWPRTMTSDHDLGTWPWEHELTTWTGSVDGVLEQRAQVQCLKCQPQLQSSISDLKAWKANSVWIAGCKIAYSKELDVPTSVPVISAIISSS